MRRILALTFVTIATAATGCVADEPASSDEDQALAVRPDTTVTLTAGALLFGITVHSATGVQGCSAGSASSCVLSFPAGTQLTISPETTVDRPDCLTWTGWTGQCAGQGNPCVITINSNISVNSTFHVIRPGCTPV